MARSRPTLGQKAGLSLGGVLLAAAGVCVLSLVSSLRTREFYEDLWAEQLVQARAIHEVEASVLELTHRMTAHMLGTAAAIEASGPSPEASFESSIARLARTALEPDQRRMLPRIQAAFRAHSSLWPRVRAHRRPEPEDAGFRRLVGELTAAHEQARELCRELRSANEGDLRAALAARRRQAGYVATSIVTLSVLLLGLVITVAWLFWRGTLRPLRRIIDELRGRSPRREGGPAGDELEELQACLDDFGEEIAQMRVRLSHSDRHLIESDKLAAMGRIAAGVAHEIRSPLTALRLRLFSLHRRIEEVDPAQSQNLRVMAEEVTRLDGIVSSFLDLSRPPRISPQPCSLPLLVDKTLEVLRHRIEGSALRIEWAGGRDLPPVLADPPQLRQVIMNLLNNAIESAPSGGCIRIDADRDSAAGGAPLVLVRIADDGGGVPDEVRDRLFDPFFSTKPEGSGLGLWIARSIATRHGGSLDLESTSAAGAAFALRVPLAREGNGHGPHTGH